ncbi:cupin-like domain-containing protein [Microcoleus sp. FACHB-1515]|uniref:cupin-like domain-containing protein n=1 Tax=Cyanophyceae TaxID=3028117 RepID=UPI001686F5EF|nr:cupin-like domain-containing protein [Microcoleus sp. FACHB-1515]MBD2089145.1 cupin-like domain-containing protein [Microcoleus sp. FACHB-1515]
MSFDLKLNPAGVAGIDRVSASSLTADRFFEAYQRPGIPVIITGLLDEPDWDLDFLTDQLGEQTFSVRCYGRDRYSQDKRQWTDIGSGTKPRQMTFTEYAQTLRSGEAAEKDMYLAKCPLKTTALGKRTSFRALRDRLGLRFAATNLNLWVGPGGHVEALHYDPTDGTLMQLFGEKKLLLFPPDQIANLYPFPIAVHLRHGTKLRSWFSQTYPNKPDFESFPNLKIALAHAQEVVLKAGDLIFLPVGWWHEVTSLGDGMTCSVNQFWHVYPWGRALRSGNKWRAHLGGVLAVPQQVKSQLGF